MSKEIIINANLAEEVRIAILENGRLVDLDIETQSRTKHKGNIYKGIVSNIEDSLDAAFIDFGEERQAFLPISEIRPLLYPDALKKERRVKVSQILQRGQEVVIQVTKDEIGTKGAAVTTYLSLPGRYVVLMHSDEGGGGISRKIESESARQTARDMLSRFSVPEGMAVIIRTAGTTANRQELFRDFKSLCDAWEQIGRGAQLGRAPTLLYREPDIVVRTIRDYFSSDVTRVIIDDEEEFEEASRYFTDHMPDLVKILEKHKKKEPVFQGFGIEDAIESLFERQVTLPSGGHIVIEQTEALVAIDVNSGRSTKEEGHAATVYKTNLEAAEEIARQLRLRDLGGIVVIDFIDMISPKHNRDIESRVREFMRTDKARVKLGRISENGTLELTRQRLRQSHSLIAYVPCNQCGGTGRVRDANGLAIRALRQIGGYLAKKRVSLANLTVHLPIDVANVVNNQKRRELLDLCEAHQTEIHVMGHGHMADQTIEFEEKRRGQAGIDQVVHSRDYRSDDGKQRRFQRPRSDQPSGTAAPVSQNQAGILIGAAPILVEMDDIEPKEEVTEPATEQEVFDDPLSEALFGFVQAAPVDKDDFVGEEENAEVENNVTGDQIPTEPSTDGEVTAEGAPESEKPKRKRFRRRRNFGPRKKKPISDTTETPSPASEEHT